MDVLIAAVVLLSLTIGGVLIVRAQRRAQREHAAYPVMSRLACYAGRRSRSW
jgi:hypothetical protein